MELLKNTLKYWRLVAKQTTYGEESAESIVPDTLPDIARIVDVTGTVFVRDREVRADDVQIKGVTRVTVLYQAEESGKLYRLETPVPFTLHAQITGASPGMEALVLPTLISADARASNPRKIVARVSMGCCTRVFSPAQDEIVSGIDDDGECCVKSEQINCAVTAAAGSKNFSLAEDIDLPDNSGSVASVLRCGMTITPTQANVQGGKAVVKAEATAKALCEDSDHKLVSVEKSFTFTQIADMPGIPDDGEAKADFCLRSLEMDPALEMNGDSKYISLSAGVTMNVDVTRTETVTVMTDAFSMRRECKLGMSEAMLRESVPETVLEASATERFDAEMPPVRVIECRMMPDEYADWSPEDETGSAGVTVSVLYMADDGGVYALVRRMNLRFSTAGCCERRGIIMPKEITASINSGGIEVTARADVICAEGRTARVPMVGTVEPGAEYESIKGSRTCCTLKRVSAGDSLWDIAKKYRTPPTAIATSNKLENEKLPAVGELLLIPTAK